MKINEGWLQGKRNALFKSMVRIVASSRQMDLGDPVSRRQVEADVQRMTKAESRLSTNNELHRLLTEYLDLGDLIVDVRELTDRHG